MAQNIQINPRVLLAAGAGVIAAAAIIIIWQFAPAPTPASRTARTAAPVSSLPASPAADLGSALYTKISNPVSGTLPPTFAPLPNPADSFYVNPF